MLTQKHVYQFNCCILQPYSYMHSGFNDNSSPRALKSKQLRGLSDISEMQWWKEGSFTRDDQLDRVLPLFKKGISGRQSSSITFDSSDGITDDLTQETSLTSWEVRTMKRFLCYSFSRGTYSQEGVYYPSVSSLRNTLYSSNGSSSSQSQDYLLFLVLLLLQDLLNWQIYLTSFSIYISSEGVFYTSLEKGRRRFLISTDFSMISGASLSFLPNLSSAAVTSFDSNVGFNSLTRSLCLNSTIKRLSLLNDRLKVEQKWFFTQLSVLPCSCWLILAHLFPNLSWFAKRIFSSSEVHSSFLIVGSS